MSKVGESMVENQLTWVESGGEREETNMEMEVITDPAVLLWMRPPLA